MKIHHTAITGIQSLNFCFPALWNIGHIMPSQTPKTPPESANIQKVFSLILHHL